MKKILLMLATILLFFFVQTSTAGKLVGLGEYGSGPYTKVEKYNSTLYAVSSGTGVKIFNLSDTNELTELEGLDSTCQALDVQVSQSTLVVTCAFNILFYSLNEPSAPELIANFDSPSYVVNSVYLENDRLYMLGGNRDFKIYDATDLSSLQLISEILVGDVTSPLLKKSGDIVYFQQQYEKVVLIDVSSETAPKVASEVLKDGNFILYSAQIEGDTLYMGRGAGVQIVDITDPYSPSLVEYRQVDADIGSLDSFYSIDTNGNMLYAFSINGTVYSADISNPQDPKFLFNSDLLGFLPYQLKYLDGLLFIASGVGGLVVIDPTNDSNLTKVDSYSDALMINDVRINNGKVVIADESRLFHFLDISNQGVVSKLGNISASLARTGLVESNFSWLADVGMLQTYDVTNFENPIQYDSLVVQDYSDYINHISKIENLLYVGTDNGGIKVYDVSGIVPSEYVSVNLGLDVDTGQQHRVNDIVPYGDYLLVSTSEKDLIIVDISSPATPVIKSQLKETDFAPYKNRLFVSGSYVLLFAETDIIAWNLSNIDSPTLSAQGNEFGYIHGVTELNESMVVISTDNGLSLLDIANPLDISLLDFIPEGSVSTSLDSDGSLIVIKSSGSSSLKIFQYNRPPQASNFNYSLDEDSTVVEYVEATDPEGDDVTFSVVSQPANGSVSISSEGQFTYQPNVDYNGNDSFKFIAEDVHGGSSEGTVTITVNPINDAPTATNVSLTTSVDSSVSGSFNASDVDGDELTYENTNPSNGSLSVSGASFTYKPAEGFTGQDSFQYTVTDSSGELSTATVTITVNQASSGGGGGSSDFWLLALLLLGFTFRRQFK
ncbi:MAG: tandem-95 repeat protein [Kangiella sp.]|nr:tandem-95 repeat protein [Kangiella sp.]